MAIRINSGAAPRLGRVTNPVGTYLPDERPKFDNPSTSVDGQGQGPAGMNPAQPSLGTLSVPSWERSFWNPRNIQDFGRGVQGWWNSLPGNQPQPQQMYSASGVPVQYEQTAIENGVATVTVNPVAYDSRGNRYTYDVSKKQYIRDSTDALSDPNKDSPVNSLVGANIASIPKGMTMHQARQTFPGMTTKQIQSEMTKNGYVRTYQPGIGEYFVKATGAQGGPSSGSATGGSVDLRGRFEYVDPTMLAPGERATNTSGVSFVGGTPTESGQAQYAVTLPGGQDDERFKWTSSVRQDEEGNWQKIYKRTVRAQYSRQWRKKQQARSETKRAVQAAQQVAQEPSQQVVAPQQYSQLVNLRADFG